MLHLTGQAGRRPRLTRRSRGAAATSRARAATAAKASSTPTSRSTSPRPPPWSQQLREGVVGPRVRRDVRDRARGGGEDLERHHRAAERGQAEAEQDRDRAGLLLVENTLPSSMPAPVPTSENAMTTAAVPSRVAPADAEEERRAGDDDQRLEERDREAAEDCAGEDRPRRGRRREHAPRDAEPARLDQPHRAVERVEEDEEQQLGARAASKRLARARGTAPPSGALTRTRDGRRVAAAAACARASARAKRRPARRAGSSRAAPSSAAPARGDALDRRAQLLGDRVGAREVARAAPAARRRTRGVVAGGQHEAGVDLAARHGVLELAARRVACSAPRRRRVERASTNCRARAARPPADDADPRLSEPPNAAPSSRMISIGSTKRKKTFGPPAQQPAQLDRRRSRAPSSARSASPRARTPARRRPRRTRGSPRPARATALAPAPPARFSSPRRNHACGVSRLSAASSAARLRDREERPAEHRRARAPPSTARPAPGRASCASVATSAITAVAASTPATIRIATPSGLPQCAPSSEAGRDGEHGHAHDAEHEARQQLAGEHGAAADRGDEHTRERAVAPLVEDARDAELDGEEEEEDGHPGGVERAERRAACWRSTRRRARSARGARRSREPGAVARRRQRAATRAAVDAAGEATARATGRPACRSACRRRRARRARRPPGGDGRREAGGDDERGGDLAAGRRHRAPAASARLGAQLDQALPRERLEHVAAANARAAAPRSWSTTANVERHAARSSTSWRMSPKIEASTSGTTSATSSAERSRSRWRRSLRGDQERGAHRSVAQRLAGEVEEHRLQVGLVDLDAPSRRRPPRRPRRSSSARTPRARRRSARCSPSRTLAARTPASAAQARAAGVEVARRRRAARGRARRRARRAPRACPRPSARRGRRSRSGRRGARPPPCSASCRGRPSPRRRAARRSRGSRCGSAGRRRRSARRGRAAAGGGAGRCRC